MSPSEKLKVNVDGRHFETTIGTLTKYSEGTTSYFKTLLSQKEQLKNPKDESIFVDRDGGLFNYILQYFRTGQLITDDNDLRLRRNLIIKAEFYKIPSLVSLIKINNTIPSNRNLEQRKLYSDTKIFSYKQQEHLNKLYGNNQQQWQLIYRASRDGFTAKLFHQFCNDNGPAMTNSVAEWMFIWWIYNCSLELVRH